MRSTPTRAALCAILFAVLCPWLALADEAAEAGRSVLAQHRTTVMTVKLVMNITTPRGNFERSREVTGTVIDPTGLTVVSLSETDPFALDEERARDSGVTVQVTDLRLLLEDGTDPGLVPSCHLGDILSPAFPVGAGADPLDDLRVDR